MNSRERVLAALERKRPDRPPTALRCIPEVWDKLESHFGVATPNAAQDCLDTDLRLISLPFIVTAAGMQPENLFRLFGDRLAFHGAIDETELLTRATPEQVYRETTRTIEILGKNGGYVVSPTHQVQGDAPLENILAVYEAAHDYGWNQPLERRAGSGQGRLLPRARRRGHERPADFLGHSERNGAAANGKARAM